MLIVTIMILFLITDEGVIVVNVNIEEGDVACLNKIVTE